MEDLTDLCFAKLPTEFVLLDATDGANGHKWDSSRGKQSGRKTTPTQKGAAVDAVPGNHFKDMQYQQELWSLSQAPCQVLQRSQHPGDVIAVCDRPIQWLLEGVLEAVVGIEPVLLTRIETETCFSACIHFYVIRVITMDFFCFS